MPPVRRHNARAPSRLIQRTSPSRAERFEADLALPARVPGLRKGTREEFFYRFAILQPVDQGIGRHVHAGMSGSVAVNTGFP